VLSYLASTCLIARSFTDKPKGSNSKLHGAGVVGGETTDRKETLDKVRSYQNIIEVK
jgi:hypothetical protein